MQGVGGAVHLPVGYLAKAYNMVQSRGGVCIADEVRLLMCYIPQLIADELMSLVCHIHKLVAGEVRSLCHISQLIADEVRSLMYNTSQLILMR